MKLEIFGGKKMDEVLRLKLVNAEHDVRLIAVDENGKELSYGVILTINRDGTMYRNRSIGKNIPVKKMPDGRIMEDCA